MNKPDNQTIQSWLKGELEGDSLREMEAWAEEHADELETQMGWQPLSKELAETIPDKEEPPYAEFFNERVKLHAFEESVSEVVESKPSLWQRLNWLVAPAALAGMAVCFYVGTHIGSSEQAQGSTLTAEEVYIPVHGVTSEVVETDEATLIVLDGLEAIPESLDIVSGESSFGVSPMLLAKAEGSEFLF
jgi:hypothetical protein